MTYGALLLTAFIKECTRFPPSKEFPNLIWSEMPEFVGGRCILESDAGINQKARTMEAISLDGREGKKVKKGGKRS